jgi:signal transduction histidine kinase
MPLGAKLASGDATRDGNNAENMRFVLIGIADTGIGTPENLRLRIYDPFLPLS